MSGALTILVAGTSWDGVWMPERHVAAHLSRHAPVLWVDPPMSWLTPLRGGRPTAALGGDRLQAVAPNTWRLTPVVVPGVSRPLTRDLALRQARRAIRRAVRVIDRPVRTTIVTSLEDLLDVVPAAHKVFYATDDYAAGAQLLGLDAAWTTAAEHRQVARADTVIVTSAVLHERWADRHPRVHLVPNGCDAERFAGTDRAPLPDDVRLRGPIAGFVGHMSERIDVDALDAIAASGVSLLLVGPRQSTFDLTRLDALRARPNVQWVGGKPFEQLPSYLRVIDVGLTPYRPSDFNVASFPLKTLEYLAAGRPVVASDLPAHRWLDTHHITIADAPEAFARRTQELLATPAQPDEKRARQAFAAQHAWSARSAEIAAILERSRTSWPDAPSVAGRTA